MIKKLGKKVRMLFGIFSPSTKVKKIKRTYNKDGVLREEVIESNMSVKPDEVDLYFEKMDEIFRKIDEAFRSL